jgi:hypothetical protein
LTQNENAKKKKKKKKKKKASDLRIRFRGKKVDENIEQIDEQRIANNVKPYRKKKSHIFKTQFATNPQPEKCAEKTRATRQRAKPSENVDTESRDPQTAESDVCTCHSTWRRIHSHHLQAPSRKGYFSPRPSFKKCDWKKKKKKEKEKQTHCANPLPNPKERKKCYLPT